MRLGIGIFLLLLGTGAVLAQEATPQLTPEQAAIRKNAEAFVVAYDNADAKGVAALWAEDGEMSIDGETVAVGREAIAEAYEGYFQQTPGAKIAVNIDSIRVLGPNIAVEKGHSEVVNDEDESTVDSYRLVYTRKNDTWLIVTADVQQTSVESPYDWKSDLGFLEGTWRTKQNGWQVDVKFEWVPGGNFLKRTFSVKEGDEEESTGVQIIGWDARENAVTSWTFGTDGGHGRGWWSIDGEKWVIETEGVSPEGEAFTATNIITVLASDQIRWQSTRREINGVRLDDTESVTIRRIDSASAN